MLEENKAKIDGEQSQTLDSKVKNFLLKLRIVFIIGRSMGGKVELQIHERQKIYEQIYLFINMGLLLSVLVGERI